MSRVWISAAIFDDLVEEANRAYPLETGGVLAGYTGANGDPVILGAIGPGPQAVHRRRRFTPDHFWQCEQLNALFERSSGSLVYLGDWHTHPDGLPRMSWLDQRTLRAIARHKQAQSPRALMLIGGGVSFDWIWAAHQYRSQQLLGLAASDERKLQLFRRPSGDTHH